MKNPYVLGILLIIAISLVVFAIKAGARSGGLAEMTLNAKAEKNSSECESHSDCQPLYACDEDTGTCKHVCSDDSMCPTGQLCGEFGMCE